MEEEEFLKKLGQRIRDLRNDRAWTLYDLEAITGIDSGDLSKLESGYTNARIFTLYKISQAFKITADKLLNFEETTNR